MNDKIKELLENAEQSDAIAKNKWRIENREQLREERKEKLKELMEKDKQQTPHGFCVTPEQKCTMDYCDENGCQNRKRTSAEPIEMPKNKQLTAVDIIYQGMSDKVVMQDVNKALICIHISHDDFIKLHRQAKEMEKERMIQFCIDWFISREMNIREYYEQTYGGTKQ
jgi:hypothetical protein